MFVDVHQLLERRISGTEAICACAKYQQVPLIVNAIINLENCLNNIQNLSAWHTVCSLCCYSVGYTTAKELQLLYYVTVPSGFREGSVDYCIVSDSICLARR